MHTDAIRLIAGKKMLLQIEEPVADPMGWIEENARDIDEYLTRAGALLIRGLDIAGAEQFGKLLTGLFGQNLAAYTYRSTPRTELTNKVYTATEYPPSETIPQHNENAYSRSWPLRIGFLCVTPALSGGNTPISDSRIAYQQIPYEIREEFQRKNVMYVRNYSNLDLPWKEVFQTDDKAAVERYCRDNQMEYEWLNGGLRTRQVAQATMLHPVTGENLWFNQAHLFHISSLDEEVREGLLSLMREEDLPRNVYFGDGTPIDAEVLSIIRKVYDDTKFSFQWEKNDLLLLDNMLFTHGREPFEGRRQVLVGMAREYHPIAI